MRPSSMVAGVLVAVACAACGSSGSGPRATPTTTDRPSTTTTTVAPGEGTGDTTAWADVTAAWQALAPAAIAKPPAQVAEDLAALRRGQDTSAVGEVAVTSVRGGEPAVVVLTETGGPDASAVSSETEITLEAGEQGWSVSRARQRFTCFRAPTSAAAITCS
jgi:hypothetical protein